MAIFNINTRKSAEEIYNDMERSIFSNADRKNAAMKDNIATCKKVYDLCCDFLQNHHLVTAATNLNSDQVVSMEDFNEDANVANVGATEIQDLVQSADVPEDQQTEAESAVACLLARMKACGGNNELYRQQHFSHGSRENELRAAITKNTTTVFAPSLLSMANNIGMPSMEAFGANIDKVLPDIRASMAITLLQFHRGLLDRIIHRRTSASPYVKYVAPYAEVYDMLKSNDASADVRNNGDHIVPFINLYGDPKTVSNRLQPIVPLVANDTNSQLYADGYVKFNTKANLFDLSVLPNQLGKSHYNFTDLVSENVVLNEIIVKLTKGSTSELFKVDVHEVNGARLQMQPNTTDSGIRAAMMQYVVKFGKNTKTITGATSTILADCTDTDYLRVKLNIAAQISLKYADVEALGNVSAAAYNKDHASVAAEVQSLVNGLTISLEGYSVDACYSEENLRKSNLAIRYHVRTFDFEISNGRNILVDYSMNEELPEFLMSLVTEATSLGQDHRGIDVIIRELMHVYDVTNLENSDPDFRDRLEKIGFQYVASQLVRPVVYLNQIDLDNVDTIRSSDVLGDIRQYVEWELMNLVSLIYQNSFYKHQLNPGEKPLFKCFTSAVILENLFSIPHIHNHLNNDQPMDGGTVEYRRVLPNGTILDCVTVTFNSMRNKIVMIPYRENNPEDILNFGHNWDYGTFVAHYNPQLDNAVNKRVFSNTRAMIVPTNPMGLYLDVKGLDEFIDMFQVTNPTDSVLPSPSEIYSAQE